MVAWAQIVHPSCECGSSLTRECAPGPQLVLAFLNHLPRSHLPSPHTHTRCNCRPVVALHFRSLLHRTPLYDAEAFPRTLTVLVGTLADPEGAARRPLPGSSTAAPPYTLVDVDAASAKATVLGVGNVSLAYLSAALSTAASQLQALGGYRHVPGGDSNPNIQEARADGILHWYLRDGHVYASPTDPHPEILSLQADVVVTGTATTLVLGNRDGAVATAAAAKGRLFAAHRAVWGPGGLASFWAGMCVPHPPQKATLSPLAFVRGALVTQGRVTLPVAAAASAAGGLLPAPQKVIFIDAAGAAAKAGGDGSNSSSSVGRPLTSDELVARLVTLGGLGAGAAVPRLSALLKARLDATHTQVVTVARPEQAIEALGL
jgi:hypothetical protein